MKKLSFSILMILLILMLCGWSSNNPDKRIKVQEKLEEINELIDNEEFDKAFEQSKIIVDIPLFSEEDMNAIVVKFQYKNRIEEGLYILNVLLLRNGKNDSTLNNLSWAYHMIDKNESANYFADKALAILPNSAYEYGNKANALRGLRKPEEAIKYYDFALELCPDFPQAIWGKAIVYNDIKDYAKSLEFFKKYREIEPDDAKSTRYYITSCYREMNQIMNAIKEYENYFKQDQSDTSPLYSIAYIYYEQKDYKKALEYYDKILNIDVNDAWAYYNRVDCYAKLDRMDEAIETLKKAIELDSECLYEIIYLDEIDKLKTHKKFITIFE